LNRSTLALPFPALISPATRRRTDVVTLLAGQARDAATTVKLASAAKSYLDGDKTALDQSLLTAAFGAYLVSGGDSARWVLRRRIPPMMPKPTNIIVQMEGSGAVDAVHTPGDVEAA
jgi:hypothetical protein